MNEVNISPCAKSATTQLAELIRHELRRINAKRINKINFNASQYIIKYKWKQLNYVKFSCSMLAVSYLPGPSPDKYFRLSRA